LIADKQKGRTSLGGIRQTDEELNKKKKKNVLVENVNVYLEFQQ
jgi:hypothetical protein